MSVEFEIKYKPSYSMLVVKLKSGESISAEAGAMTYMTPTIHAETRTRERGIIDSLGLAILGRQSLFVNDYTARDRPGEIGLVSAAIGDIEVLKVTPETGYIIQKSSYIASTKNVDLDIQWQGFTKGLFGQGLFMIKVTGRGDLFINTFGAIDRHKLGPGEQLVVDNFHLVAFTDTCNYRVAKFGGLRDTLLGGEGLVTEIAGPGEVLIQTKNIREFVEMLWPFIQPRIAGSAAR